jgi:chitin synthase
MTYTPVLCEPEDFAVPENQYSLRQMRMRRRTELLIAITMYNESDEFLIRTLSAVFKNIRFFCELNSGERIGARRDSTKGALIGKLNDETFVASKSRTNPDLEAGVRGDQMWDEDAWQKIVVVIISDGRTKVHPRVMKMLQVMGVVQPEVMLMESTDPLEEPPNNPKKPVQAHLFETTCQAIVEEDLMVKSGSKNGVVPVQMLFCLKEKNKKKLNSHKWLFRAFCPLLNPNTIVLIDVGTRPKTLNSIYHLWKAFDRDENIAGACGEICVMLGKGCDNCKSVTSPLTAAQNFEYKISNILDKTLESCFGYISVLPGAFSAYRWEALQDTTSESGPLVQYFKGETPKPKGNVFSSNMYLAEDRILCFELVAKYNAKWVLHYVKDARAETDVPGSVHEFISQRRRWLNGTFFCQIYALFHLHRLWTTRHSIFKKLAFMFQFLYFTISLIFSWFAIANFYLAFYLITRQTLDPNIFWQELIFQVVRLFYWAIIIAQFICSMGNRPQGARFIYVGSFVIFGLIMMFLTGVSVYLMVQIFSNLNGTSWLLGGTATTLVISIGSTYGVYIISSLLFGETYHILSCMFQYLTLLPSFINTIQIYAFCKVSYIRI